MRKILILAIVISPIIAGWSSWVIADSYDFEPSTTNNPLHVEARVVYGTPVLMTCPEKPCSPPQVFS
jgi:hypothetical protein